MRSVAYIAIVVWVMGCSGISGQRAKHLAVGSFTTWQTGRDAQTVQLIPSRGKNALVREDGFAVVHVRFVVKEYGEVSFPLANTAADEEAKGIDLANSQAISITYRANHPFVVQLRQTGVHGGIHNHVYIPASAQFTTVTVALREFKDGLKPLDLSDVAKFNFAFLSNNSVDGYADLQIRNVVIRAAS